MKSINADTAGDAENVASCSEFVPGPGEESWDLEERFLQLRDGGCYRTGGCIGERLLWTGVSGRKPAGR